MSFGRNLAKLRKEKGLTQEDLVEMSGVAISQIRRYETGKSTPSLAAITKLVEALGASIDEMVFGSPKDIARNRIADRELLAQFEAVAEMDENERYIVRRVLEGMIVRNQIENLVRPRTEKSWSQRFREITDRLAGGVRGRSLDEIDAVIDDAVNAVRKGRYGHWGRH
jgi:transcriptional regulator with XRE-family HTH domain